MALTKERFKIKRILYKSMKFKDSFTTAEIKTSVLNDKDKTKEEKEKEEKKIVVSNDAYLNAEMIQDLINNINAVGRL